MELTHDFRQRTALLLGDERMARPQNARLPVSGLGAVAGPPAAHPAHSHHRPTRPPRPPPSSIAPAPRRTLPTTMR